MSKIINYHGSMDALVWLKERKGMDCDTEIIVPVAHEAILVRDGGTTDSFTVGRYNLCECAVGEGHLFKTPDENVDCRIYYVKKEGQYNIKWEANSLCITDPVLKINAEFNLSGLFAIKIIDSKTFLSKLLMYTKKVSLDEVKEFFRQKMLINIKDHLVAVMAENGISIIGLTKKLMAVSKELELRMRYIFQPYGVSIENLMLKKLDLLSGGACCDGIPAPAESESAEPIQDDAPAEIMYCPSCGKDLPPMSKYCYQCGQKIE